MTKLSTLIRADTCFRNGEVVSKDDLRIVAPSGPNKRKLPIGEYATLREFVDQHFFTEYGIKLPIFGQANGKRNGTALSKLSQDHGYYVGKKEVAYFDRRLGGFVADWVNCYPLAILWEWVETVTDGAYKNPNKV